MTKINRFLQSDGAGGILLVGAAVLAMIAANSPWSRWYEFLLDTPLEVRVGGLEIAKPLLLWINDGLMAIFFFLIGLELKRELCEGELSDPRSITLPAVGAVGGMAIPALIYAYLNRHDTAALQGWAIPAATDIAFALGVLKMLGNRIPAALRVLLVSIAIFDDLGAIIIIALFYTSQLSLTALVVALACMPALFILNRRGVTRIAPYVLIGLVVWVAVLKSGVHATLAGVAVALFVPMRDPKNKENSPLLTLEHDLHPSVTLAILPIFAFANAGLRLDNLSVDVLFHPVPLGIALGLFLGKPIGILGLCYLAKITGLAQKPPGVSWRQVAGVSCLAGIGFTMSLFIGSLAFEESGENRIFDERLGIIIGSLASAAVGYLILRSGGPQDAVPVEE